MKPLLRWAGSKRKLLPTLRSAFPKEFERYVEPFAGSACVFFAMEPAEAILGDINLELIETYEALQQNASQIARYLSSFICSEEAYYMMRSKRITKLSASYRAARFIYLNRFCFNGLYRTNTAGNFNVPYGGERSGTLPTIEQLKSISTVLKRAKLVRGSFENTLQQTKSGDFVYLDPPYAINSRRVFNEYSNVRFGVTELKSLRYQLMDLDSRGIPFLVSYGMSREAIELAAGYRVRHTSVQRQIAGFASNRRKSREIFITNY